MFELLKHLSFLINIDNHLLSILQIFKPTSERSIKVLINE